ncbi:MAG: bifunctional 3,4-dihydroxy-2-butanone-4-phosphate synthase/GTP cyclohydrolase II [Actinobacteria bacterium]|nr:bifunctional 3,4-dihydroxy-2-butanone-4-phosphate synthase/GTP cyclohydrolase II [Actinomycetota bacterium]
MHTPEPPFSPIEDALEDIRRGKMIIIVDAPDRENEGDLCMAAEFVTADDINFMATHARGLVCLTLTPERCDTLGLQPMVAHNVTTFETAFTVTIEAKEGISTGISAADRAHTCRVAVDPAKGADDIQMPGHIFPLRARPGGVLERTGQTEASVDVARLAGCTPAGVICEVMNPDGTMARVDDLARFKDEHDIKIITVADLIEYRRRTEQLVERVAEVNLPTAYGDFHAIGYRETLHDKQHLALIYGEVDGREDVLVRVHSECLTGDVFHSLRCDCGEQLNLAMQQVVQAGSGVVLYMAQEGRGIGLLNKLRAYELQEQGRDTVEANVELGFMDDQREYGIGAQILADLGLSTIKILTNNPRKIIGLEGYGLKVTEQVPIEVEPGEHNADYLRVKREKLGHALHHQHIKAADILPGTPPTGAVDPAAGEPAGAQP